MIRNFLKMYAFALVYLVSGSVLLFTKAEPKIVVFQNMNGAEVIVSSLVSSINGTTFSLICKITTEIDSNSEKHFDNSVIWNRKRRKSRFSNNDDLVLPENSVPGASLSFTNVSLKDQGVYFCTSLKYKLLKGLNLIVQPQFPLRTARKETYSLKYPTGRRKHPNDALQRVVRDVILVPPVHYNYTGAFTPFPYTYPPVPQFTMRNDLSDWLYGDYNRKNNPDTEFTFRNDPPNWFYKDKDHDNSANLNAHSSLLNFSYLMIGAVLLFIIIYVAIRCCHEENNDTIPDSRNYQPRNRSITHRNMCSHVICIQNRSTHPFAECMLGTNDLRLLATGSSGENLRTNHLDLPPTYDDSTANLAENPKHSLRDTNSGSNTRILNCCNDSSELPPSYEEALCNASNTYANSNIGGCRAGNSSVARSTYLSGGSSSDS